MGGCTGVTRTTSGAWVDYFVITDTTALTFTPSNTARLSVGSISVKEVAIHNPIYAKSGTGTVYLEAITY